MNTTPPKKTFELSIDEYLCLSEDVFGFDITKTPSLQRYLGSDDTKQTANYFSDKSADHENHPVWVRDVWSYLSQLAKKCDFELLIGEFAVKQDAKWFGKESGFSTIVCGNEFMIPGIDKPLTIEIYRSQILETLPENWFIEDALCLRTVFGLAVSCEVEWTDDVEGCAVEAAPFGTSAIRIERQKPYQVSMDGPELNTIVRVCKEQFTKFIKSVMEHFEPVRSMYKRCVFILIPITRPDEIEDAWNDESFSDSRQPETGGVVVLIAKDLNSATELNERLRWFFSLVRSFVAEAILKESAQANEIRLLESEIRKKKLVAYDGIGHSLRAYVEATGYKGAAAELRKSLKRDDLPDAARQSMTKALRSLEFFEHAEGLGSLMRLYGWINQRPTDNAEWLLAEKVRKCFKAEEEVEEVRQGKHFESLLMGYSELVESQANLLASKDRIPFRIMTPQLGCAARSIKAGGGGSSRSRAQLCIPPLVTTGDHAAVVLALSVGILEPLRNASMYLKERKFQTFQSSADRDAWQVEVVLWAERGTCQIYIGNPLFGGEKPSFAGYRALSGIQLVNSLLFENFLGSIRPATAAEVVAGPSSVPGTPPAEYIDLWDDYLWLCVEACPLKLFDLASKKSET
jgi:hypothetical protein